MPKINKDIRIAELEEHFFENFSEVASLVFTDEGITDKSLKQTVTKLIEMFYDKKTWKYSKDVRHLVNTLLDGYYYGTTFGNLSESGILHSPDLYRELSSSSFRFNKATANRFNLNRNCGVKFMRHLLSTMDNVQKTSREFPFLATIVVKKKMIGKVLDEPALKKRKISELELEDFPNVKFNSFDYRFDFFGMTKVKLLGHYLINESLEAYFKEKHIKPIKLYGMFKGAKNHSFAENAGNNFTNISNGSSRAEDNTSDPIDISNVVTSPTTSNIEYANSDEDDLDGDFECVNFLAQEDPYDLGEEDTNADTVTSSMDIIDQDEILPLENDFFESEFDQGVESDSMPDMQDSSLQKPWVKFEKSDNSLAAITFELMSYRHEFEPR
ncbi:hypothetical protein CANINC_000996 [Pichia inconspicua]|uniref:Uncharacterized protein n=1 Tax=Pichia inconspicua TaxID=52247 RepID=A0A4T0X4Q2_9ASCO|nr:hypothetical protein CANINC_000996 [[Candida] inconspicua]